MKLRRSLSLAEQVAIVVLMAISYYVYGWLIFLISPQPTLATPAIFIPEALSLAYGFIAGPFVAIGVFVGQLTLALAQGVAPGASFAVAAVNAAELLIALYVCRIRKWNFGDYSVRDFLEFTAAVLLFLQPFSSILGNYALFLFDSNAQQLSIGAFTNWWLGNSAAQIICTPLIVQTFVAYKYKTFSKKNYAVIAFCLVLTAALPALGTVFLGGMQLGDVAMLLIFTSPLIALAISKRKVFFLLLLFPVLQLFVINHYSSPGGNEGLINILVIGYFFGAALIFITHLQVTDLLAKQGKIYDSLPLGFALIRSDIPVFVNPIISSILSLDTSEQLLGQSNISWSRLFCQSPWDEKFQECDIKKYSGRTYFECVLNKPDKKVSYLVSVIPVNNSKREFLWMFQDISQQKAAAELMQNFKDQAEKESLRKSRFLASISHDIRTPVHGILGLSEEVHSSVTQEDWRAHRKLIYQQAKYLAGIISDTIELSKIELGAEQKKPDWFQFSDFFEEIEVFSRNLTSEKIRFSMGLNFDPSICVFADRYALRRITGNLLENSFKYTASGVISLMYSLRVDERLAGVFLEILVTDSGIGIDADDFVRLLLPFERNVRGGDQVDGVGLGLSVVNALVRRCDGEIKLLPTEIGASISVILPIMTRQDEIKKPSKIGQENRHDVLAAVRKILVVEDVFVNRVVVENHLKALKQEFRVVENGQQAVSSWCEWSPDIVLMDIQMPIMGGLEAMQIIREKESEVGPAHGYKHKTVFVACTAHAVDSERAALLEQGFDLILTKPAGIDQLRFVLSQANSIIDRLSATDLH